MAGDVLVELAAAVGEVVVVTAVEVAGEVNEKRKAKEVFDALTPKQQDAFVTLLVYVAASDGKITNEERNKLYDKLGKVAPGNAPAKRMLEEGLEAVQSAADTDAFVQEQATILPQDAAFAAMLSGYACKIARADPAAWPTQKPSVEKLAHALGMPPEHIAELVAD